tara:strand:- start:36 stop:311 length:276 start_codon:yes stop_codon:yes gene_type:complete
MKELGFYITGTPLLPPCGTTMDKLGIILLQRRSYGKTQILFMRERLGIEPGQLSTIPAFRGLRDHIVTKLVTKNHFLLSIHTSPHQFINTL